MYIYIYSIHITSQWLSSLRPCGIPVSPYPPSVNPNPLLQRSQPRQSQLILTHFHRLQLPATMIFPAIVWDTQWFGVATNMWSAPIKTSPYWNLRNPKVVLKIPSTEHFPTLCLAKGWRLNSTLLVLLPFSNPQMVHLPQPDDRGSGMDTIWLFNIAMENPPNKWRFIAEKIIYKWAIFHGYVK